MSAITNNLSNVSGISQQYAQYQNLSAAPIEMGGFFEPRPNTVRPEKPKLNLKCDVFGVNVLEDDDRKNSLSPALSK
jgi:hypothetical protein